MTASTTFRIEFDVWPTEGNTLPAERDLLDGIAGNIGDAWFDPDEGDDTFVIAKTWTGRYVAPENDSSAATNEALGDLTFLNDALGSYLADRAIRLPDDQLDALTYEVDRAIRTCLFHPPKEG